MVRYVDDHLYYYVCWLPWGLFRGDEMMVPVPPDFCLQEWGRMHWTAYGEGGNLICQQERSIHELSREMSASSFDTYVRLTDYTTNGEKPNNHRKCVLKSRSILADSALNSHCL